MKIHEFQAKEIFKKYKIPVQDGQVIDSSEKIEEVVDKVMEDFATSQVVIKAQIHAGGRGKGGGVKFSPDRETAVINAQKILGMQLVTPQTGTGGQRVKKVMIAQAINIKNEFYAAITLDRSQGKNVFMVSQSGGMDIEEVAAKAPEKIIRVSVDANAPLMPYQARCLAYALNLQGSQHVQASKIFQALYYCYKDNDASLVEVNPLVLTEQGDVLALDGKINFDDNALYRNPRIKEMRDVDEEDFFEVEAQKFNLNFIKLDGNVGCMVNGAGLAMATMDLIKLEGGDPANFLDVGGGANVETVKEALRIILSDKAVKSVLINIFGGIVRCDRVAGGIVSAAKELNIAHPLVVRLEGTNAEEARNLLAKSKLNIIPASSFEEAARLAVNAAK